MSNLLIDVGSTNIKYSVDLKTTESLPFPLPDKDEFPFFEVDAEKIISVIKGVIDKEPSAKNVYISVQMHGYVLSDKGHKPIFPYISWRDSRSRKAKNPFPFELKKEYGTGKKYNLAPFGMATIRETDERFKQVRFFDTLGSYLYYALTGEHFTHITDACASGFYTLSGDKNLLTKEKIFFDIVFPSACVAFCAKGTYNGKKIYVPVGDQQASILGVGAKEETVLNTGTATQFCQIAESGTFGDFESRPYFGGKVLCTVTGLVGGATFDKKTEKEIIEDYKNGIEKLPKREKLIAVGGLAEYHADFFENIGKTLGRKFELKKNLGALTGLMKLANERETGMMLAEIPFTNIPLILKNSGFDFFIIDCEHGGFDYTDVSKIIMTAKLCGLKSIVRLADNTRKDIIKFLDMGADGLLLQMTNRAEDIQKVVEYGKYAPLGKRGLSTMRAHTLYDPPALLDYMAKANAHTEIYAQIETVAGVENVEKIVSVEGVAGCLVGPNDLSADYGCLGEKNPKQIMDAIEKVAFACTKAGKKSGIITGNGAYLAKAKESGMQMYSVGSELNMIKDSALCTVQRIKEL